MDYFYTVESQIEYEEKIKRSIFIATIESVSSIDSAKKFISTVSSLHKTASHNCWAYIVGDKAEISHSSDAGEPSGTAGKPMLNGLQKHDLSNVAVVVTRYYGGVKLGVRGLIEAYGSSVENAVSKAKLKKIVKIQIYKLQTSYDFLDILTYNLKKMKAKITDSQYTENVTVTIEVEEKDQEILNKYIVELTNSGKIIRI